MIIQKKVAKKSAVKASNRVARRNRRSVRANDEVEEEVVEEPEVEVAPEASDLLFEAEDVAELLAEVTGQDVAVTVDEDAVVYEVGNDAFTVEAEGDEEVLESSTRVNRTKNVKASRKVARRTRARR